MRALVNLASLVDSDDCAARCRSAAAHVARPARRAAAGDAAGHRAGSARRPEEPDALAHLLRRLRQSPPQPAHADHAGERASPDRAVAVPDRHARQVRGGAARLGRRHLRHRPARHRLGDRRADRPADLALPPRPARRPHRLLRARQSRIRRARRSPVQDDARRARRRDQPEDRRARVGHRDGELPERLQRDDRAARGQGQGARRRRRRRVRRSRLHRCLRCADAASRSGGSTRPPGPDDPGHGTWRGTDAKAWEHGGGSIWVPGAYDPELNLVLLGHRQRRTGLQRRASAKATTSTPRRSSRSTPTPASCAGTISSRRTTSGTGTRRRCRCSPTSRSAASRARSCCSRTATASSTCSTARPAN